MHGSTGGGGVEQLMYNQQHLHMLAAQQTPPRMIGLARPGEIGFFFFFFKAGSVGSMLLRSIISSPRRPDASNNNMPRHSRPPSYTLHMKFSISRAPRCSPAHGRATVGTGSPAVTRRAQRVLSADRCAAQRPQTDQIHHLRDKIKKRGDDFYR